MDEDKMTFYLVGLGLNEKSLGLEALEVLKKCSKVYLEDYTVDFPYSIKELENQLKVKIIELDREEVESEKFVEEAKNKDIALLVYGDVLAATTHISLVLKCKKDKINWKILHNASIFDAVSETGLQMYKFGKTASIPAWRESFTPDSFADIIKDNLKIKAHTLVLVDIGLDTDKALEELRVACQNKKIYLDKILVCSRMGQETGKIYYGKLDELLGEEVEKPFCIVIPSKNLHEIEKEALETWKKG